MIRWIVANKLPYDSYLVRYWYAPMYLQPSIYSFVGQFSLRAHNSSHLYFSAPISCSMPIVKNFWDIPYYTMLYLLSRYHCLDYPTYCAFVIQINYSEVFPIAMIHLNFHIFIEYLRRYNRCMSWNGTKSD